MEIKNYCMVILDNVKGIKKEILSVSDSQPRYIDAENLVITTFKSALNATELKNYFQSYERSFLLFEMGKGNYGTHIMKKTLNDHLFASIEIEQDDEVQDRIVDAVDRVRERRETKNEMKLDIDFSKLTPVERTKMTDDLIDKGIGNWTEDDKVIMEKLSNI